jgi:hypothetical protein
MWTEVDTPENVGYGYTMNNDESKSLSDVNIEGQNAYPAYDNPYPAQSVSWQAWDAGYWFEHDLSFAPDSDGGIEEGYGDFYDYDAVSQGMYDDDPNPYDGTYSEE